MPAPRSRSSHGWQTPRRAQLQSSPEVGDDSAIRSSQSAVARVHVGRPSLLFRGVNAFRSKCRASGPAAPAPQLLLVRLRTASRSGEQ